MPKAPKGSSTKRRERLADYIDEFGETMVQACSVCVREKRVCRVHAKSGRCNECNRHNLRCDIRVTKSEFDRLVKQKKKLRAQIEEARREQEAAREALSIAWAREDRLRKQIELIDRRADDAIAVESAAIEEQEREEALEAAPSDLDSRVASLATYVELDG